MITNNQSKIHEREINKWVLEYSDQLYAYAAQRINDKHSAKDIVQETFAAAWRNVENFDKSNPVKPWLFAILKNKIIDHHRKHSKLLAKQINSLNDDANFDFFNNVEHWTQEATPHNWSIKENNLLEKKEFYNILNTCKQKLKEIQSIVFSLKYLDGLESEEICHLLSITDANYWVIVHRAKLQLRACLEKNLFIK